MRIKYTKSNNYALIGCPLGHSLSPLIHSELFKISGENATYCLKEIPPDTLETAFENELKLLNGFNVTIPYKTDIIRLLNDLSPKAKLFGSVNTVVNNSGSFVGYNTDSSGFLRSLDTADIELGGRVLILGCGGVSRMFAFESALAEADITLAVRDAASDKVKALQSELKAKLGCDCSAVDISKAQGGYDLIVNGTPVGMFPNVDECPLDENVILSSAAVFDAIYNPLETRLIKVAKEGGLKYSNGLNMLVWQAAVAQEIWTGYKFSPDDIKPVFEKTKEALL